MAVAQLSSQMQNAVNNVLNNKKDQLYAIECIFYNTNNNFQYKCLYIESLIIEQDYINRFCDAIMVSVMLRLETIILLMENLEDLKCSLTFKKYDKDTTSFDLNSPPKTYTYRAIFEKLPDINKETYFSLFSKKANNGFDTETTVGYRQLCNFQLYNDKIFDLRKKNVNFIGNGCNVKDIIHTALYSLGITNINMIEPDNTSLYSNFVVPPNSTIETVFGTIQNTKGVYAKGCEYYITDALECYVYPPYETNKDSLKSVHIYNIPQGYCSGSFGMHYVKDNSIYILSNVGANNIRNTEFSIENDGNCLSMEDTSLTIDGSRSTDSYSNTTTHNTDSMYVVSNNNTKKLSKNSTNIKYVKSTNPYLELTGMSSSDGQIIAFGWTYAEPFLFEPCQRILYHYDTMDGLKSSVGVCHYNKYIFTKTATTSVELYVCNAILQAFISNEIY